MSLILAALLLLPIALPDTTAAACWSETAQRYRIPVNLLRAIAQVESNLDPRAVNRTQLARTGTYDTGLMQINSSHLRTLKRHGFEEAALLDPCVSLNIGAWLLANLFARHGVTWDAVGAYNASCTRLQGDECRTARARYAWRVYRQLHALHALHALPISAAPGARQEASNAAAETPPRTSRLPSRSHPASSSKYSSGSSSGSSDRLPVQPQVQLPAQLPAQLTAQLPSPLPGRLPRGPATHRRMASRPRPSNPSWPKPHRWLHRLRRTARCPTTVRAIRRAGGRASGIPRPEAKPLDFRPVLTAPRASEQPPSRDDQTSRAARKPD